MFNNLEPLHHCSVMISYKNQQKLVIYSRNYFKSKRNFIAKSCNKPHTVKIKKILNRKI